MLKIIQFTIDYKITYQDSLNQIYASKHWSRRDDYAHGIQIITRNALSKTMIDPQDMPMFTASAVVSIVYPLGKVDIDNHSYFAKCVIDALKGVLIIDDSPKHVVGINQSFADRLDILVKVEATA